MSEGRWCSFCGRWKTDHRFPIDGNGECDRCVQLWDDIMDDDQWHTDYHEIAVIYGHEIADKWNAGEWPEVPAGERSDMALEIACGTGGIAVYDHSEQDEIIAEFTKMLRSVTADGGRKRAVGLKPSWKVDTTHIAAIDRHIAAWESGEKHDPDSAEHPLVHAAWRCLAVAWQEERR